MTTSPAIQLLTALWNLWQSLAADGAARLRDACGLDLKGFIALSYLQEHPYQPAELASALQMPRYEVSRLLGTLEAQGYLARSRARRDGRQVSVQVTDQGRLAWERGVQTVEAVTAPYLAHLGVTRRDELIQTLAGLVRPTFSPHPPAQGEST